MRPSRLNQQVDEIYMWVKMTNLKKEVGENNKSTHLQNIFTRQVWKKFAHILIMSTNSSATYPVFTYPEGVFGEERLV